MGVSLKHKSIGLEISKKKEVNYKDIVLPPLKKDELLLQTKQCGVCNSDIEVYKGLRQQAGEEFGHEGWGKVIEKGSAVKKLK